METDFAIHLVSESFKGKTAIARHRMVNALLKPEFDERGLHALSLRLKTPEEWEKEGGGEMRWGIFHRSPPPLVPSILGYIYRWMRGKKVAYDQLDCL